MLFQDHFLTIIPARLFGQADLHWPLSLILLFFVILILCVTLLEAIQTRVMTRFQQDFMLDLQIRLNRSVAQASWAFLIQKNLKHAHHMVSMGISQVNMLTQQSLRMITDSVLVVTLMTASLFFSFKLTGITCVIALFSFLLIHRQKASLMGKQSFRMGQHAQVELAHFLDGIKLAKSYNRVAAFTDKFESIQKENYHFQLEFSQIQLTIQGIFRVCTAIIFSFLFGLSFTVFHISLPTLLALLLIFARLLPRVSALQQGYLRIVNVLPVFEQIEETLFAYEAHEEKTGFQGDLSWKHGLRLENVTYCYGEKPALKDLSCQFLLNTTTAIVGPSGAGKTTLADILLGLLVPQVGQIFLDHHPLRTDHLHAWRAQVSYVPQEVHVFHGTVRENLLWAQPESTEAELWEVLNLAAAETFVRHLPKGLETIIGDRGVRLSGGERQRLALARALLRRPHVLLLDEATSSLDTQNEEIIYQTLKNLHGKLTLILIAHRFSTIQNADQVLVLDKGHLIEQGTPTDLLRDSNSMFYTLFQKSVKELPSNE